MKTKIIVNLDIDDGDPNSQFGTTTREDRLRDSAAQAVFQALLQGEENGFTHLMSNEASIKILSVKARAVSPDTHQGHKFTRKKPDNPYRRRGSGR